MKKSLQSSASESCDVIPLVEEFEIDHFSE